MEEAVKAFAQEAGLTFPITGKGKTLTRLYEYNPSHGEKSHRRKFWF